jgi:hypothetical protein
MCCPVGEYLRVGNRQSRIASALADVVRKLVCSSLYVELRPSARPRSLGNAGSARGSGLGTRAGDLVSNGCIGRLVDGPADPGRGGCCIGGRACVPPPVLVGYGYRLRAKEKTPQGCPALRGLSTPNKRTETVTSRLYPEGSPREVRGDRLGEGTQPNRPPARGALCGTGFH